MKLSRLFVTFLKVVTLIASLAFAPLVLFQKFSSDDTMRFWWVILAPAVAVLMLLVWYGFFGKAKLKRRVTRVFCIFMFLLASGALFGLLFKYEGSTGGGSFPKYGFRFSSGNTDPSNIPIEPVGPVAQTGEVEGVIDSPQFLGPNRDGHFPDAAVSLDFETNPPEEIWRQPIGEGWSSFSVVGNRALTQEQHGEDEFVTCYELTTGKRLWAHKDADTRFTSVVPEEAKFLAVMGGEGTRATPTVFEENVYTLGSTGVLNCLELATGKLRWTRDTLREFSAPIPKWGKSSAPLVIPDPGLIVVTGADYGPTLIAYRLDDGEPVWEYEGNGASYSSPRLLKIGGEVQIVSVNGFDVTGHDPATGIELWKFPWKGQNPKVGQPLLTGEDQLLVTASYGMGTHLLKVAKIEEKWSVASLWETTKLKAKFSSAIIHSGHAFALNEGRFACIDLKSGDQKWRAEKYGYGQNLLVGDQILIQAENGAVAIVEPNPEAFSETARLETGLTGITWNAPTLAGQYLLVRNGSEAVCYRLAKK